MGETKYTPGPWLLIGDDFICAMTDNPEPRTRQSIPEVNRFQAQFSAGGSGAASREELAATTRLAHAAPDLLEAAKALLDRDERNTCPHDETYRGGNIWEICHACGAKWADDEGGRPEWRDPPEWIAIRAAIAKAEGRDV